MIGRLLVSLGSVAAAVGLTVYGMGTSYVDPDDGMMDIGLYLMIGGVIATVVGIGIYRAAEASASSNARRD